MHPSHARLCPTEACVIVGDYIRIGEFNLVLLGFAFFITLWVVYSLASRYGSSRLWTGALILLLGALAFDGGLLGFQYFSVKEQCHLCVGVGAALLTVLLLFSLVRRRTAVFLLGLSVWAGGGIARSLISIPDRTPLLEQIDGISLQHAETEKWPGFYYFFSLHCPHCTDILANLAGDASSDHSWKLFPLDRSPADLKRIAWAMRQEMEGKNIYEAIVRVAKNDDVPDVHVPDTLVDEIDRIRAFFEGNGFTRVPLLIVDESRNKRLILTGGAAIVNYLHRHGGAGTAKTLQ